MGALTIVNKSAHDIHVKVATDGSDRGKGVSDSWYLLKAGGGKDTWSRNENQVISFFGYLEAGALVRTVLGVVGATTEIQ